jgi:dipeptidyl aminopeptidase/acylaminoacyl peptidase
MNRRQAELFDVYRLNVSTAELQICGENPGNIQSWMTDHDGRLRLATTTDGVHTSILARDQEDQPWRTVATYDFKESATPLLFSFDNQDVFVSSNVGRDKAAIFRYDLKNGSESELIAEHEAVDLSRLLYSRRRKVLTAVAFETDRRGYQFFDETRATIQALLDEQLPDTENALTSHSRDESRYVVYAGSDRTRGHYHLLDRNSNQLQKLFDLSPWLRQEEMARLQPIGVTSRDGWNLPGYVTRPVGVEGGPGPLIVHPHGGPWHRDSFGFQAEVQFLASRGYSVLQVNFRGSTGYGRKFWEASFGEWGGCMQDDITDAVQWAIDTDIADPKRIGIYGGSYGGYATLAGLTKTPDLYACGVSFVGPSNLFTFLESIPPYWKPFLEMMHEMVGHPERDQARLRETSPFFQADRICAPLLVAQGANDPRVKKAESDQIVSALQKRGVPVQYLVKENEGHGFHNEENMFEFYRILEQFLAEHLQP